MFFTDSDLELNCDNDDVDKKDIQNSQLINSILSYNDNLHQIKWKPISIPDH